MGGAAWGASGLAWLTGQPDGPPDFSRAAVLQHATQVLGRFTTATGVDADAATLLAGRAGLLGFSRAGRVSAGGASRLLAAADGWWAITLSRADDVDAVPALIEADCPEPWTAVAGWASQRPVAEVVERARLLDLPAAALGESAAATPSIRRAGPRGPARDAHGALVVDLTSLWAGPLCGQLLTQAGATVIKVENPSRPDGTRRGPKAFFDWMNSGKLSCTADFDRDTAFLARLLDAADVVLEGSRPAALARRGLGPFDVAGRPGRVWLQITAHGGEAPGSYGGPSFASPSSSLAEPPGFGDDTAVAGGLVGRDGAADPVFCGDAIADPLTGIEAAVAVLDSLAGGGGEVITLSLAAVAARYAALPLHPVGDYPVSPPARPHIAGTGPRLGADNARAGELVNAASRC
ncbi:CoA transferase [Mycolicibacter algericus]|uniref:CoA transferase n=2 Tax=Mycolicibacter algericus TaxID=1288388 RepID=A0A7I9Y4P2_MYCAL|nr:CoA transferase [Mycolicibacter algericus]OQZ97953.1 CoA transferase [Mycolicibacter algericus DSM 45454]GFG83592.1 CoA transferase [Mycolicibacter algericus]